MAFVKNFIAKQKMPSKFGLFLLLVYVMDASVVEVNLCILLSDVK